MVCIMFGLLMGEYFSNNVTKFYNKTYSFFRVV